uniref:SCAN box domain-containing protein n=1 Tax=Paramormyrops kingsleyae TaxID=1676925 RepID=A0A3B3T9V3_9TELE
MATFDLLEFTLSPTQEQFDNYRKSDLVAIAGFFNVVVPVGASKQEIKQVLQDDLVTQGILLEPGDLSGVASCGSWRPGVPATHGSQGSRLALLTIRLRELELEIKRQDFQAQLLQIRALEMEADRDAALQKARVGQPQPIPQLCKVSLPLGTARSTASLARASASPPDDASHPCTQSPTVPTRSPEREYIGFHVSHHIGLVPIFRESKVDAYFPIFECIATTLNWPRHLWSLLLQCKLVGKAQEVCLALSLEQSLDYDFLKATVLRAYELVPEAYRQNFRKVCKSASQTHMEFAREKSLLFDKWSTASGVTDFHQLNELLLLEEFKNCVPDRVVIYLNEQKVTSLTEATTLADEFVLTHRTVFAPTPLPRKPYPRSVPPPEKAAPTTPPVEIRECFYCHEVGHLISVCPALRRKNAHLAVKKVHVAHCIVVSPPTHTIEPVFQPFVFPGFVSLKDSDVKCPITILCDTGAAQSFMLDNVLPFTNSTYSGYDVLVQGIELGTVRVPLYQVYLKTDFSGFLKVAVRPRLPVSGITFILGNDITRGKVVPLPEIASEPAYCSDDLARDYPAVFPTCVLTRSQARKLMDIDLADTFMGDPVVSVLPQCHSIEPVLEKQVSPQVLATDSMCTWGELISTQGADPSLKECFDLAVEKADLADHPVAYFKDHKVLMRKWTPPQSPKEWATLFQVVVPCSYRSHVLALAHSHP